jgi:lipopolysaccharide/colanic/teichoic acid biosynthesis glycosyltransferase
VLLIGSGGNVTSMQRWLQDKSNLGFCIVGALDDSGVPPAPGIAVLGKLADFEHMVRTKRISQVVVLDFPAHGPDVRRYVDFCEREGIRFILVTDLNQHFGGPVAIYPDQEVFCVGLHEEPLENPLNRLLKRSLDIAISLPVVVFILPPLMLVVWLCQRKQSPGPLFFIQLRDGVRNRPFKILKFRTMHADNPNQHKLPSSKDDPRLYPMGTWLRRSSIDEMPQFWNALCGSMSVVGPRPHLMYYNEHYRRIFYKAYVRSFVKPGITGLAQVQGLRGSAEAHDDIIRRMKADIAYLENWSLLTDIWLIFRTTLQLFKPPRTAK